jgi:hypothetical protein
VIHPKPRILTFPLWSVVPNCPSLPREGCCAFFSGRFFGKNRGLGSARGPQCVTQPSPGRQWRAPDVSPGMVRSHPTPARGRMLRGAPGDAAKRFADPPRSQEPRFGLAKARISCRGRGFHPGTVARPTHAISPESRVSGEVMPAGHGESTDRHVCESPQIPDFGPLHYVRHPPNNLLHQSDGCPRASRDFGLCEC